MKTLLKTLLTARVSLRYKIVSLFAVAIIVPTIVLGVVLISVSHRTIRDSIFREQQGIVSRLADRINSQLENHYRILFSNQDINQLSPRQQQETAKRMLIQGGAFAEISLVDSNGSELWTYSRLGPVSQTGKTARKKLVRKVWTERSFISQVFFTGENNPYIILSVPLRSKKGAVVAKLDFRQLWEWISEVQIGRTGHAFIVDKKGVLVAHKEQERVLASSDYSGLPVVKDFLEKKKSTLERWSEYTDEKGEDVVALYKPIPKLGWAVITQIPSSEVYEPVKRMYQNILFWTVFWSGVFLFLGFHFVQRIVDPIALLRKGADEISKGRLDIKLDIHTGDELEDLAGNFEKMAQSLKDLEAMRQDLIRMIIHDLKSPLSGIMGSLDYLESGLAGSFSDEQKKIVSLARKSSESMLGMIQNLLDVAKMEDGKLVLNRETFDLGLMLDERARQLGHLAAAEQKKIIADVPPGIPKVSAEKHLIERVINNLLSNAISHTTSGGVITLSLRREGGSLEVKVADNGAGIPPEYIDKIFEKFVQIKRKQAHLRTGAGLGLTFCKMVVETHGGSIRVESELNMGSSFIFTLPIKP